MIARLISSKYEVPLKQGELECQDEPAEGCPVGLSAAAALAIVNEILSGWKVMSFAGTHYLVQLDQTVPGLVHLQRFLWHIMPPNTGV